jgi:hypothetical protein
MITNERGQIKPIRPTWAFRGATAIYYITLVVRALYPIFVWSFYLLTAVLALGALSSGRRRR